MGSFSCCWPMAGVCPTMNVWRHSRAPLGGNGVFVTGGDSCKYLMRFCQRFVILGAFGQNGKLVLVKFLFGEMEFRSGSDVLGGKLLNQKKALRTRSVPPRQKTERGLSGRIEN